MSSIPQDEISGKDPLPPRQDEQAESRPASVLSAAASQLGGRWQVPLMVLALVLLGASVWRLRPKPQPPKFDELLAKAEALKQATLYEEASGYVQSLLDDPVRTEPELARLHGLMTEIIFAHESGNVVHGPKNCRSIIEHSERSLAAGEEFDAEFHRMRGLAFEWLGQIAEALPEHRQSLAKGIENPWGVRQHILQLRRLINDIADEELHAELDGFLAAADIPLDIQFWAAERKIELYAAEGRHDLSEKLLADHLSRFQDTDRQNEYDFLRALAWYHVGSDADAERILRDLREKVVPGNPLYGEVGWLMGALFQRQGAPEFALTLFEDVLAKTVPSPSRAACALGRAECLAEMEQYEESLRGYEEVIRTATQDPVGSQIDLKDVRESTTAWYQATYMLQRRAEAMGFLKIAARLAPPVDVQLQIVYSKRLADLAMELGRQKLEEQSNASASPSATDSDDRNARDYLIEAGEEYQRLARLATLDADVVTAAMWEAAEAFDLAGQRERMIEALEVFVREYPTNPRVPEALLQMGRAHQAAGDLDRAIQQYQRNLIEFPRTPAALASLIPLAECFRESGAVDKAEQTLLRIVAPRPGDSVALITPEAPEFREALFRLGDLYVAGEEYEKAIARYEEALERYAEDPRSDVAMFQLADSYRKSVQRIRADLQDPKNIAFKDSLRAMHQRRLEQASRMFERTIERYQKRPASELSKLDRLCLKLSHLYSADCVYDLSLVVGAEDSEPFARSLSMYEKAAWLYQDHPLAMTAYVQIMNCYLHMGKVSQAWMALQRARWALRNVKQEAFVEYAPQQDRAFWENYLVWLEKKPIFASMGEARN